MCYVNIEFSILIYDEVIGYDDNDIDLNECSSDGSEVLLSFNLVWDVIEDFVVCFVVVCIMVRVSYLDLS